MEKSEMDALLKQKEKEVIAGLEGWAERLGILKPGQVILFGPMRIEKTATVRPDEAPMATEEMPVKGRKAQGVEFIAPARMTSAEVGQLVGRLTGTYRPIMQKLLTEHRNNPTDLKDLGAQFTDVNDFRTFINRALVGRIRGRSYRLAGKHWGLIQLWEVKKIKA